MIAWSLSSFRNSLISASRDGRSWGWSWSDQENSGELRKICEETSADWQIVAEATVQVHHGRGESCKFRTDGRFYTFQTLQLLLILQQSSNYRSNRICCFHSCYSYSLVMTSRRNKVWLSRGEECVRGRFSIFIFNWWEFLTDMEIDFSFKIKSFTVCLLLLTYSLTRWYITQTFSRTSTRTMSWMWTTLKIELIKLNFFRSSLIC